MAVWKHNGTQWIKQEFHSTHQSCKAFLFAPGPSLNIVNDIPEINQPLRNVFKFAVNTAYPKIKPDIWIGMDGVECYDENLWNEPFVKICRGGYQNEMTVNNIPVFRMSNTHFIDLATPNKGETILENLGPDIIYQWRKNTLVVMLHLIINMGFKEIYLIGFDMGGSKDYYDNRVLTDEHKKINRRLYRQQVQFIHDLSVNALPRGIKFISCTPDSPLNEFLSFIPLKKAVEQAVGEKVANTRVKHVLETSQANDKGKIKMGVLVPSKDRPKFLKMARRMIETQTRKPDAVCYMDGDSGIEGPDLTWRYRKGCEELVKKHKCNMIVFWEDDDYYSPRYLSIMEDQYEKHGRPDIFGISYSLYYHLGLRRYIEMSHPKRASMFNTVVSDNVVNIPWPKDDHIFLDIYLWGTLKGRTFAPQKIISMGMKHNEGTCGGSGHTAVYYNKEDNDLTFLNNVVKQKELKEFYEKMSYRLGEKFKDVVFVHVPRVAGNSIREALHPIARVVGHNIRASGYKFAHQEIVPTKKDQSIAFVRNPVDRVVSAYYYLKGGGRELPDVHDAQDYIDPYKDINDFIEKGLKTAKEKQIHFMPQHLWLCDKEENVVVGNIGKYETLEKSFKKICERLKIPQKPLSVRNERELKSQMPLTDKSKKIIYKLYRKDFELFNYKKPD